MKNLLHILTLTSLLTVGTFAQSRAAYNLDTKIKSENPVVVANRPAVSSAVGDLHVSGKQNSAGIYYNELGRVQGNSFVFSGSSESTSVVLTVSLEYSGVPNLFPGNKVSGGNWSMAVYQDGVYVGTMFGSVGFGKITWTYDDASETFNSRNTVLELVLEGGIDGYEGVQIEKRDPMNLDALTTFDESGSTTEAEIKNGF
jgi:hypothetical protein